MPGGAGALLQRRAHHRIAGGPRDIEWRAVVLGLLRCQPTVVDAIQPVGVHVALEALHVMDVVRQHQHAALGEHDVVVQLLAEPFPEIERMVVEPGALVVEVVRADDRGVAPGVAAAEPALLDHRDVGDAVLLGEIVGGPQPVAAGADDDHVVFALRLGVRPLLVPVPVPGQRVAQDRHGGEMGHRRHLPVAAGDGREYAGSRRFLTVWMRQNSLYACVIAQIDWKAASPWRLQPLHPASSRLHPGPALHALRLRELRGRAAARRRRGRPLAADPLRLEGAVGVDEPDPIERGIGVQPDERLGDPARFDYIVVVGGLVDEIERLNPDYDAFLRRAAASGVPLVGVCTGAFILHRAGLMHGYRCCVSWFHHDDFLEQFEGSRRSRTGSSWSTATG